MPGTMEGMEEAVRFSLFDLEAGAPVSWYGTLEDAAAALRVAVDQYPEQADDFLVIGYNKVGEAVGRLGPQTLLPL